MTWERRKGLMRECDMGEEERFEEECDMREV